MSVSVSAWVWQHSASRSNNRLVLLAIADCAGDDGANAYPSEATIAGKVGVSTRTVKRAIAELVEIGELAVTPRAGAAGRGGRTNRYRVIMGSGDKGVTGDKSALVTDQVESGDKPGRSGDTGGPRSVSRTTTERPTPKNRAKNKTAAPETLAVSDGMRAWATKNAAKGIDPDAETERFLDYHRSKGTKNLDWQAAWRNWMRNTKQYASPNVGKAGPNLGPTETYR